MGEETEYFEQLKTRQGLLLQSIAFMRQMGFSVVFTGFDLSRHLHH